MYEQYWNLNEKPFENTPDPRFIYYSQKHEQALMRLLYAVKETKGAGLLTGEYGSGKTLLSRILIDELIKSKIYEVALATNPALPPLQLIQELIYQLENTDIQGEKPVLLHHLQERIYHNFKAGKRTAIIIDEAQLIEDQQTFEELRLLLNFQLNNQFLITLLLIGQPELIGKINQIPQLEQRMSIKFHLGPLDRAESSAYIAHRLSVAGRLKPIFTRKAEDLIYDYSQGIPRKINNACDISLFIGSGACAESIDKKIIEDVIHDLTKQAPVYAQNV
ncbi:MAG: AAA family ATPase [Candidatus Omnitrophica bacterium]|nr:AAA family ATPase [Candidatus Omnitrophota bacterium]